MPGAAAAAASPQQPPPTRSKPRAKRTRRHGCQPPWAPAQIVALGVVLLSIVVFYVFSVHELPSDLRRIVLVLVSAQVAMVALLYVAISLLDPAHPAVIERQCQHQRQPSNVSATQSPNDSIDLERNDGDAGDNSATRLDSPALSSASSSSSSSSSSATAIPSARTHLRCALCDATVSTGTRHCSVCRKCVAGFDHHCVYINTCIGSRNYPLFIALLTCSILLVATQLVIASYAIDRLRRRGDTTRALVIAGLCLLPLLQLVCMVILASFHSYLFCKGLRTYEWLQRFNQKTAQRYAAKTPKWKHQNHNRPVRYPVDDDEENDNSFSHRNSKRDRRTAGDSTAAAAPTIEVASHV